MIEFRKAELTDAELLIHIYNAAFYDDYIRYSECPAYGKTKEMMRRSIMDSPKFVILCNEKPVGCISCKELRKGIYEVGCLCVIPDYQRKGIGTAAIEFVKSYYTDWERFSLITPADKIENVRFYTEKCGFAIQSSEMDGNVKVARFVLDKTSRPASTANAIRWGIIGTGRIAHTFAKALMSCENAVPFAAASRTGQKAEEFASKYGFLKAYGSYAELAQDPDVDVVYIATPMSAHYHDAKLCLENGKNVLCEKSVTVNSHQLEELLDLAKRNGLFFMEAMWMKCRPVYRKAMEWIREGRIGSICCINAEFCNLVPCDPNDRLFRADCGGGALLDLAVYPLTLAHDVMGVPGSVRAYAHIRDGIDLSNTILLQYDDAYATVESSFEYPACNRAMISGSEGMILFDDGFHNAKDIHLYDRSLHHIETYTAGDRINGYEYEIEEVMYCVRNGLQDSVLVPQRSTLEVMRMMDECRRQWGLHFPDED